MSTVEVSRDDGEYTAVHVETGISGSGETEAIALAVLAEHLAEGEALSPEFAEKVERRREEYERGDCSSLDDVRDRLNG